MALPEGVNACELILGYDESTDDYTAHVALVVDYPDSTDDAIAACEAARAAAWGALADLDVVPNLRCRTAAEHQALR